MTPKIQACLAGLLLLLTGCASQNIGSRSFPLTITATTNNQPINATAYVVPNDEWLSYGKGIDDPGCRDFLAKYKVTDGKTPVTIYGAAYEMVIIIDWNGHLIKASTPAVPGDHPSVNVEVE